MRFGGETILRRATNEDWTVIITEYKYKEKDPYCRVHMDFEDSNIIHEPFEKLCKRYGCKE